MLEDYAPVLTDLVKSAGGVALQLYFDNNYHVDALTSAIGRPITTSPCLHPQVALTKAAGLITGYRMHGPDSGPDSFQASRLLTALERDAQETHKPRACLIPDISFNAASLRHLIDAGYEVADPPAISRDAAIPWPPNPEETAYFTEWIGRTVAGPGGLEPDKIPPLSRT